MSKMYQKIKKLLFTQTAKDASVMTISTAIASVIAAIFFILAARLLGPAEFGLFSLATAASFMFADVFDIAINTSLIRFVSRELRKGDGEEDKYLKFIFKTKYLIGFVLVITVGIIAVPLSRLLFAQSLPRVLFLVSIGTAFQLIYTFGLSHLQARREFVKAGASIVSLPLIRLFGFLSLIVVRSVKVMSTLVVYFFTVPIAAFVALTLAPKSFLRVSHERRVARKFFRYSLPLTAGFALATVSGRIDNFILANLAGSTAVGFYAAAFRLFTPVQYLTGALSTVFAPRFASFENKQQVTEYFRKSLLAMGALSFGVLLAIPLSPLIIRLFYGIEYQSSVVVLQILAIGFSAFLLQAPFTSTILYYFAKTRIFAVINAVQLAIIVLANLFFIPIFQEKGSAIAFIFTQFVVLVVLAAYTLNKLKKN